MFQPAALDHETDPRIGAEDEVHDWLEQLATVATLRGLEEDLQEPVDLEAIHDTIGASPPLEATEKR